MSKSFAFILSALLMATALPLAAQAETLERQFDNFFRQQEKFDAQDKKKREEGYVLEPIYNKKGKRSGQISLGGGPTPPPVYGAPTTYNFTGRDFNDQQGGILNLRIGF